MAYRLARCYMSLAGQWKDYDGYPPRGGWLISLYTTPASKGIFQADIVKPARYQEESGERLWRKSTGERYLGDAQRWANAFLRAKAERERQGLRESDDDTFSSVYVAFLKFARERPQRFGREFLKRLSTKMRYFQQHEIWNARLGDVKFETKLRDYFHKRQKGDITNGDAEHSYAASTWNYEASCINATCRFALEERHLTSREIKAPYYAATNGETGYARRPAFTFAEVSELLRYLQDEGEGGYLHPSTWKGPDWQWRVEVKRRRMIAPLVATMSFSGARITELRLLQWRDLDLSRTNGLGQPICVFRFKKEGQLKRRKKASDRHTVCWAELTPFIERWRKETQYPNPDDFIFYAYPGNWLKECAPLPPCKPIEHFSRLLIKTLRDKGMKIQEGEDLERSSYSFRHFYITESIDRFKIDPLRLAENCGTSPEMIRKFYGHFDGRNWIDDLTLTPSQRIDVEITKGAILDRKKALAAQEARKLLAGKLKRKPKALAA